MPEDIPKPSTEKSTEKKTSAKDKMRKEVEAEIRKEARDSRTPEATAGMRYNHQKLLKRRDVLVSSSYSKKDLDTLNKQIKAAEKAING